MLPTGPQLLCRSKLLAVAAEGMWVRMAGWRRLKGLRATDALTQHLQWLPARAMLPGAADAAHASLERLSGIWSVKPPFCEQQQVQQGNIGPPNVVAKVV